MAVNLIVILESNSRDGGALSLDTLFRFLVPVNQRVARPDIVGSVCRVATAEENAAVQSGEYIEERTQQRFPIGTPVATIKSFLESAWTSRKAYLDSLPNQNQYYGVGWNGTAWSA
jgi:hypothetical protein